MSMSAQYAVAWIDPRSCVSIFMLSWGSLLFLCGNTILKRVVQLSGSFETNCFVLFAGLGISWFSLTVSNFYSAELTELPFFQRLGQSMWNFDRIRILGVIQISNLLRVAA